MAPASAIVVPRETLRRLQHSDFALVRWVTDLNNCPSRWVFTMGICTPLLPLFIGGAAFDVRALPRGLL